VDQIKPAAAPLTFHTTGQQKDVTLVPSVPYSPNVIPSTGK
jgi:hypothetical protein